MTAVGEAPLSDLLCHSFLPSVPLCHPCIAFQVVEEGGAGMAKTLAPLGKRLPFGGANPSHVARPPPPTLQQLFARSAPEPESSGEVANITDDEDENAAKPDAAFQNRPAGSPARPSYRQQDQSQKSPQNAFSSLSGTTSCRSSSPFPFHEAMLSLGPLLQYTWHQATPYYVVNKLGYKVEAGLTSCLIAAETRCNMLACM